MPIVARCVPQQLSSMFVAIPKYSHVDSLRKSPWNLPLGFPSWLFPGPSV